MLKVKHARTADVVVGGWRAYSKPGPEGQPIVGSLLLGLYDDVGRFHQVGSAASFTMARRLELLDELKPYEVAADAVHPWLQPDGQTRVPGGPSRWTGKKDLSWIPLAPELVAEVAYDQMEGPTPQAQRFRHVARFVRWRPDRVANSCLYDQLEHPVRYDLESLLSSVERLA
jgi:ATP-dependent DNA ligase